MTIKKGERPGVDGPGAKRLSTSVGVHNPNDETAAGQVARLPLAAIGVAPECQQRAAGSAAAVADYAAALSAGAAFPPIVVFLDGGQHWLADGNHRLEAHRAAGIDEIAVEVRAGTRREAVLFAAGANAAHGLRRTQADKAKAIATLLADPEWRAWSDKEIARRTATSDKTVAKARRDLAGVSGGLNAEIRVEDRTFVTKHGTEATRRVAAVATPSGGLEQRLLRGLPDGLLVAEVRRRGFVVEGSS